MGCWVGFLRSIHDSVFVLFVLLFVLSWVASIVLSYVLVPVASIVLSLHWSLSRGLHPTFISPYIIFCIGPFISPFIGSCIRLYQLQVIFLCSYPCFASCACMSWCQNLCQTLFEWWCCYLITAWYCMQLYSNYSNCNAYVAVQVCWDSVP